VCEKHKVNQFYTAPTAIRALMGQGNEFVTKYDLSDLKLLGTVGEPINPEAWNWYNDVVGGALPHRRHLVADGNRRPPDDPAARRARPTKPGSATKPFFGVQPVVLDPHTGQEIRPPRPRACSCHQGQLARPDAHRLGRSRTLREDLFLGLQGYYFSGDGCRRDADGYYWITGRVDDVINVSGHRMGTAEVESALVAHAKVAEAAVVGYPHDIKGQGIYAYVTLMNGIEPTDELRKELEVWVRTEIGPIAKPDLIQWAPGLPKTRSGKIMRRILRKIAEDDFGAPDAGDTSTLEPNRAVVDDLEIDFSQPDFMNRRGGPGPAPLVDVNTRAPVPRGPPRRGTPDRGAAAVTQAEATAFRRWKRKASDASSCPRSRRIRHP
jgi:acetyl-CoA synthetase